MKAESLLLIRRELLRHQQHLLPELLRWGVFDLGLKMEVREMSVEHNQVLIVSKVAKWQPVRIESKRRVRNVEVIANREHKWQPVRAGVRCPGCNQVAIANREHKWQPARIEARCRGCNRMAIVVKDGIG